MEFKIKESTRARNFRLTIEPDGAVILTKPIRTALAKALAFLEGHRAWIDSVLEKLEAKRAKEERLHGKAEQLPRLRRGTAAYKAATQEAKTRVQTRVQHFAGLGAFSYKLISIRNQKTRWGSCSAAGTLSFNYRLIYLTPEELDYLVVHELAHTKYHNHGAGFWAEVGKWVADPNKMRGALKRYRW